MVKPSPFQQPAAMNALTEYILYRIIGNDLPPRHTPGQTIANVQFILEQEPLFKSVERRWLLNRLVDPSYRSAVIKLLERYQQAFEVIDFSLDRFKTLKKNDTAARLDEVIGINAARNVALRNGKRAGRWVLPFDGSCFFTERAWQEIDLVCGTNKSITYLIVPMLRVVDQKLFLKAVANPSFQDENPRLFKMAGVFSEPQIMFRNDSQAEFNETIPYGKEDKAELLRRLGVSGAWDRKGNEAQEATPGFDSENSGRFAVAGFVWRLQSGNRGAERDSLRRFLERRHGIDGLLKKLDQQL